MKILYQTLLLLGSIGFFLYAMKIMSEALQKFSGKLLRKGLNNLSSSSTRAILTGTLISAIIQSVGAVSVAVISFVNAGLLTLRQSIGSIMGANLGATVTAWIIALVAFRANSPLIAVPLFAISIPLFLSGGNRKNIGQALIGFSLLLLAIYSMLEAVTLGSAAPGVVSWLSGLQQYGAAPLFYVLIGIVTAALVQTDNAIIALAMTLGVTGLVPFTDTIALIIGINVGGVAPTLIAASGTNIDGRRAALFGLLFNLFGMIWILPFLNTAAYVVTDLMTSLGGSSPMTNAAAQPVGLALFHTLFNLVNTLLLALLIPQIETLLRKLIPDKKERKRAPQYLQDMLLSTGEMLLYQAQKELFHLFRLCREIFVLTSDYLMTPDATKAEEYTTKIAAKYNEGRETTTQFENFFAQLSNEEISSGTKDEIRSMLQAAAEFDTLAAQTVAMSEIVSRKRDREIWFAPPIRAKITELFSLTLEFYDLLNRIGNRAHTAEEGVALARRLRRKIRRKLSLRKEQSLVPDPSEELNYQAGIIYSELLSGIDLLTAVLLKVCGNATEAPPLR